MTILTLSKNGTIPDEIKAIARKEGIDPEILRTRVADGSVIAVKNSRRKTLIAPLGIGKGLKTKVNANIGTSGDLSEIPLELKKLEAAVEAGADAVMDLSTGSGVDETRRTIIENSPIPVGTVPIYQAALEAVKRGKSFVEMEPEEFFECIEKHAEDGVDFVTVHCGITMESVESLKRHGRVMGVVSRGGALMTEWMLRNRKENPLYEHFDKMIAIAKKYDLVLSLGDALRPGAIADASDNAQIMELLTLGRLTLEARKSGVQIMIEGPGHMPMNQIEANVVLEKKICQEAPFYVLGPLVTDVAAGYDHISSAIGGAIAAAAGADFLCYVTPAEHLRLPSVEDVRTGVIASRIAAHAADIVKGVKGAQEWDMNMSMARKALDWHKQYSLSIDPERAKELRESLPPADLEVCTMCGAFCAIKLQKG
ncbi:MAG TPA: phosphomethylpyrimidine synthase ThiC [bacterium]